MMKIRIGKINYGIKRLRNKKEFWFQAWTPAWHGGRGKYVSVGLYFIGIYRGY
jgi:hypothetical protein